MNLPANCGNAYDYTYGYNDGYRDGFNSEADGIEQDFAYKSSDYTGGYRTGFHEGRKVQYRLAAKRLRHLDHFLDRLNGTHKQHWFDKDETGYSDEQ